MKEENILTTACIRNCSGSCIIKAHVKNGKITQITTDNLIDDSLETPQLRACVKGRSYRERVYSPNRLKYPMKRVGERGEGKFKRISWDEALDIIADKLTSIKENYGNKSMMDLFHSGVVHTVLHSTWRQLSNRFFNMFGGSVQQDFTSLSEGAKDAAIPYILGDIEYSSQSDLLETELIIMWGWNPAETTSGTNTSWYIAQARQKGIKTICIDPRHTETVATLADEWLPIKPGTDIALASAMAYVMIKEDLCDDKFINKFTIGYEEYKKYILGKEDGIPKTPQWAAEITGLSSQQIQSLAREYTKADLAMLIPGLGLQRTAYGEQISRALPTLAAMTGNIGLKGGNSGIPQYNMKTNDIGLGRLPTFENSTGIEFPIYTWSDYILQGKDGGYQSDIKASYFIGSNILNQTADINKGIKALKSLDFIVVHELFMTRTAKYADILLPVTTFFEREDIMEYDGVAVFMPQIIEPMYEAKSDFEIFTELGARLGFDYTGGKSKEEWLRNFVEESEIPYSYEEFKEEGIYRNDNRDLKPSYYQQIHEGKPFNTPSGKIEIYSERLASLNDSEIPPIPKYIESWETPDDELINEYPLQLILPHDKYRVHSQFNDNPLLQNLKLDAIQINTEDAKERNISDEDEVLIYNERGKVILAADVTERIRPGVVAINQGGLVNILTSARPTPLAKAATMHTTLVEVEKN